VPTTQMWYSVPSLMLNGLALWWHIWHEHGSNNGCTYRLKSSHFSSDPQGKCHDNTLKQAATASVQIHPHHWWSFSHLILHYMSSAVNTVVF
jgi:hypothetical protein